MKELMDERRPLLRDQETSERGLIRHALLSVFDPEAVMGKCVHCDATLPEFLSKKPSHSDWLTTHKDRWLLATIAGHPGVLIIGQLGSANLIRYSINYVRLPIKTLWIGGLVLASTIIIAGLPAWTLSDFSDVLAGAETIVSSTAIAQVSVRWSKQPILLRRQCSELIGKRQEAPKLRSQLEKAMGAA